MLYPSVFSRVFTEERMEPRSVECCRDVCPSVGLTHLNIGSWISTRVTVTSWSPL